MTTFNKVKATAGSVGEWDGQEQLAADNVNRIYKAIFNQVDEDYDQDHLAQAIHTVWDDWGSDASLLTITDDEIYAYVEKVI